MSKFLDECDSKSSRFLQPGKCTCVQNFAAQNMKNKVNVPSSQKAKTNAKSQRDMFVRISEKMAFERWNVPQLQCTHCHSHIVMEHM